MFFQESDHGVGQEKEEDDAEIRPMPGHGRKDHGRLDHPRMGPQKYVRNFRNGFVFFSSISFGPYLAQPFLRFGLTEAVWRRAQFRLQLRHGK